MREHVPRLHPAGFQRVLPHDARRPLGRHDGLQSQGGGVGQGQQPRQEIHRLILNIIISPIFHVFSVFLFITLNKNDLERLQPFLREIQRLQTVQIQTTFS